MENKAEDKKPVVDKYTDYLYGVLKDNNAYDGDYNKFYNEFYQPGIKGYTYRKELYDTMTSHGIDLGASYEDFANWIGLHAIDPQTQQTPMGADSISKDMKPVEVTPTKKPEAKKEEKPEVSAEAVSENQHPTDTLQDFNPNVSRMRNAGTDYYLQAAEEISNNAYSKSLEELANQAAKDLKKKAYQKPKEDSYVRLNQTARYIPIRSLPKDADLDSVFKAALNFEQMCGGTKEYTFAPLGGDVQERFEKWKALNATADNNFTQETASMSPNAVYLQARNLQALGKERPAWISELRWNEASDPKNNIDYQEVAAKLVQEDQQRRLKRSDGAYQNNVSLNGMYHANYTASMASDIYNTGTINTLFVLFQDGRIRPLQAPDPSVLRGGWEAQRELFRRQYEKMTFGEEGKEGYTDPYEKNRVVGNFLQNGEVCHIIYFPYMIEQRRWDDAQELIKIGLGGKFNEEGVLLNPDDRLQIVPVVVKNGESEEDAIAKAKVELDNEISKKLPYKETYLQQQIAQAREALKKEQERLKQLGKHDAVKGSYLPPMFNSKYYDDLLESSTEEGVKRSDEVALARGNIRKLEESIKKYTQALEALRTGDKVGAWGGFLEGISDLDNWTFGLYNLRENLVAVKAHEGKMGQEAKDRLGLARSLSQESMSAFHRHGEGRLYGPAFGAGYSFPFTIGAIATYGAGNVAARGIIRGGSRMAAKYGTNWLFDTTIRATTRLAAINAAGVIDSSFQMPRIISDAAIEKMGLMNYTFDENQRIVVTGTQQEKSWGHSLLHSGLNTLTQNASERIGTYVLEPVAKAFGIGKISLRSFGEAFPYNKTIHMIQNGAFSKAMSKVYGTFEKGGYNGFVNEVLEEYIANPMTATFDENYTFADIFDSRQNLDTALSVWASSIFMLGFSSTASSVKYYRTLRSVNSAYDKAEANARRLFGNENWDKIQNTILRLEGEPLVNAIYSGVCQNKSLSDEQKKAFLNYVRAQKAQAVFNNAVSEKYFFSLTGEELNEMNAMTIHAYAEGRNMQTPQEYAQAQQAFADTREMAMSALGVTDDIDAYLDTLGETPAEQLKKGVEAAKENGLDEKAANAALSAYLNAREQQKGAMDGITSDESIRRQHADSVIRQITFENEADSEGGSGKVILVNVKGREKPVFLVRGRYENGSITGETVVVSEGNGVIEMIPASEVEGIVEESDAVTERQRKYDKIDAENKEQQRLINLNMDTPLAGQGGILMDEEGHRRQVGIKCVFNDEQGNPASVLVVDQNNNDYLIPIDVFREQRGRGRKFEAIEPYLDETDEEYHAAEGPMNEEYNLANKEQEGVSEEDAQGAAEGVTPQSATDATEKPTKPEVKYDYHVKMKDGSGNAVSGRVTNLSADGVEIEFDAPYNGKMVDRIPLADFDNGVSEIADANGNVLWNETEAVGDTEVAPQVDATPTQVGQEDAEKSAIAQAEQEHKPTALERIPKDENGNPIYEQTDAETAFTGLTEEAGNVIEAEEIAKSMVEDKEKALEKAKKIKLPSGVSVAEKVKAAKVRTQAIAKAQEELDKWKAIAEVPAQQRAKVVEERIAKEKAEAEAKRKAEEEAKRANEEAESELNSTIENVLNTLYKKGKDYASKIFNMKFFDFAKTPDFMKHLGMTGSKFTIRYGVIARHFGKDGSHDFTQSEWEQIPHAIEHPFAITQLKNKEKGFRIYTALKTEKGEYVVVGVDVKNAGRDMEVNAIATMFGRRSNANLSENEEVIYKSKEITPEQEALLSRPNSDQYPAERELSIDKVTESAPSTQENGPKNSTQSAIESASAEVETSPTEAQKKAGNYKMGHVKVGAFDVTIENPKGSERSGTDANGKKWSVKMNNTYGYIRGTEGVDGDHIDVFLAEDMDKWDGKYVFVVDQYNPDGTFDEHKVMLGFNSTEEARSAYLSNYEKGWENGRRIVVARIKTDDFQKWVDSSHRKTKPFAHYVIAGAADVSDNKRKPSASKKGKPRVSKEDEVKRTVEHFPMETPEEATAFDKRVPEMKDSELLAYMQEDGKGDINSAYHMNIYDEYDYRHTDEQTEAYNTYIQQLYDSNTTLEQAEEMLGNILGDVEGFATDERSQLIGQSDALQDYITELERQKENERAKAENKPNQNESDKATPSSTSGKVRMQKAQGYSEFAEKHGVNADDVRAYAEGMALGNVVMANQAFTEIRRTKRIEHRGMKLSEFAKAFNPIKKELYEKFGNVDELDQEYVRRAEEERNMMEAARKKAEEEERKRQAHLDELSLLDDAAIDERYMEALQRGDEATAREMLDEAARRKGYGDTASDYQGVGAWVAPANPGYENDAGRRADVEDNAPDVNIEDIALGYSLVDEKYWQEPRKYMQTDATAIESVNAIREAIAAVRRGEKNVKVKVYRAVPTSVKEGKLRNGDWVTPSKDYAKMHGEHRLEGKYRIIEDEVSVNELWWDGNDSREWGFDNGKGYKYKNVKNNRKSDDLVTRDDKGNVIPPSKRFNQRKADERYQKAGTPLTPNSAEVALRDAIADLMRKSGLDVIDHEVGQQVLDEANRDELRMSLNDNREYEGKTSKERSDIQYKKAKELLSALHEAGFKGFEISRSITPFGVSTYIQGDLGLKFRISDHGVSSFGRIFGEEHISLNTSSEYVVQLAKDRKKDINAQAEKYKKERAIKEEREKRANEKWNRIKANFEGMVFKRNDRTYQDYNTFSNSISINRQNGHKYQRRYVMQTAIGKSGADTAYRYEWAEPADIDEYGVATNIGSDRPSLEFIEAYDEADTAPIIREHRVYHGSGADFDHFDHSHMGEGEGAQVYGWGTYVTEVKGIGEGYAIRSMNGSSMSHEELSLKRNELEYYIDSAKEKLPFLKGEYKAELEAQISEWEEQLKDYEEHNFLYTVEIPDDNGKNYLDWDENTGADLINRIRETLRKNADLKELYDGAELNAELERLAPKTPFSETYIFLYELLGSDKAASQMLHDMGFTGIKYPADYRRGGRADGAKNYVIFNEEDAKITDRIRFFRTSNGEAYGFTVGGKIYIDPRIATAETPIHEYAHLWATAMREGNPTEWKNIVGLMKGTSVWAEVQKLYPELKNDDDIADEVLATFSGRRGAERLRAEQQKIMQGDGSVFEKAAAVGALARVKQALSKFWKGVADFLGIHYTSAEEVADRVMKDLLEGVDPRKFGGKNDERVRKQFIGEKGAAAADHAEEVSVRLDNLAVAREMEKAGKDAKAIKMATGWERGADGKWRYEIPEGKYFPKGDAEYEKVRKKQSWCKELDLLSDRIFDGEELSAEENKRFEQLADEEAKFKAEYLTREKPYLSDWLKNDELFKSYPELKSVEIVFTDNLLKGASGYYSERESKIVVNTNSTMSTESIIAHEVQHAIQHIEGFARGGNPETVRQQIEDYIGKNEEDVEMTKSVIESAFDLFAKASKLEIIYPKMINSDVEWQRQTATDAYWDALNTIDHSFRNFETEVKNDYSQFKGMSPYEIARTGYHVKETIEELKRMSDEYLNSLTDDDRYLEELVDRYKKALESDSDAVLYTKLSGEVESRNVQARMGMNDEERRASLAAETEDVAREDQIFLQDGLNGVNESREPSIWLPKDEYAKVAHAIATNKGFKNKGMNYVFTDNNYYIYTGKKNGDFSVHYGLPIEGNEDTIKELINEIGNGTIRRPKDVSLFIAGKRSGQNNDNYNSIDAQGRPESYGRPNSMALRQPTDSRGSVGDLGTELHKGASAEYTDRGAGREAGGVDDNLYRQGEDTPHTATSSESKSKAAQKATENLNLGGRVVVHESVEGLEGKEATAKGWYDTQTGQIHVVLSNNANAADVTQTILHEAVAHHGLRELFGHNVMDAFLDSVLAAASQEVKDAINELRRGKGWNFRTATEEYLAGLAERTDFERMTAEKRGLFATIRRLFNHALEFLGLKNHELSDRELAYILWCSYQNLKTGEKGRYVAEAERIAMRYKLKAGKNAMTDTEKKEHSVLLRGKLDNLQEILAKDTYERLVTSGSHLERTAWVDMLSPLQDLQHAIEKNGGFKLGDFENPYNAYITMSSRNYAQMDIYKRTLYADMIEAIHALGSETGRSYEEIKTYVMAKHGMERQKYMAGKAAEEAYDRYKSMHPFGQKTLDYFIDEYEEKSFAGLTELFGTQSVSDAMDEAQKYVEEVEAEAGSLTDSMWDSIRAATKSSLQRAYEAGLISKETYDNVSSMYQYYIPLRGFDETTSDEVYEYFGDQTINGGTGSFMKKAKGRKSVADDPFAVIGNMAEMAIMQSNRNLMKQQLLNLALNHPSDLISVSDLYVKFDEDYDNGDGTRGAWVPVAVPDTSGMTTEEANQVMLDFQDDMEEKVKDEPDTYALAHQKPHIPYRVLGRNMNEHQVMVKRGGKTYILTINGNPRAAQAINGLLNPDATENPGAIALKAMTNWIARMATARNVEFAISNAMRDLEFSTTLIPKEGTEYYGRYVKNYLTCVKNIGRLVNRLNGNTLDMSNPLEKAFYDFIYNGGETGYTFMKGVERYKGEITKALSELRAKEGKSKIERLGNKVVYGHHYIINDAWNIYMKGAEYLSRCTEDWVRFAVFLTSRQMGRSMEQSIMDAKEVTVNFNRKGAGSKSAGKWDVSNFFSMNNLHFLSAYAASAFKNFYAFSNASIQGLDKNVRLHLNHTAGMLMWDGAAVTLGMLSAMCIPLMLSAIGGDPDDYWDMPESMRRMGIMLPLGKDGRFLTLPMSIEHRAAYGIGELLGTVVCGSENLPASEITFQAFEQLSQILPLDLTEGNGSMLSLVPTAVRPEVEIAFNKNWLGMPIYKEPFNKNTPAFRNVYQSTNPNYIAMSKWLNEVQGGGDYERAGVQVNPAMVQHLVESYTGGAGKFVSRTSGVIAKIIQGEQIRSNEIPFYRTLVKSVDDRTHNRAARERFQREYDKGQKLIYKIDNYQKESARGNSQYVKELDEFAKSKDFMSYMLWKSYNSVKSQFDNARSYIGDDKDKRAALDHAQMLVQKMMTECARAVENSKTQEEADEKIGRIQSEYTPQIKETLSKVEE